MLDICRICLGEIDNDRYISLSDHGKAVQVKRELSFCLPEIALDLTKSPVVCELCVTRLHMMYTFHNKCIRTENIIKNYIQSNKLEAGSVSLIDLHKGKEKEMQLSQEKPILMPTQLFNPEDDFIDDLNNALDKILDNNEGDDYGNINMSLVKTEVEETEPRIDYTIVKEEPNLDVSMDINDPENMFEMPVISRQQIQEGCLASPLPPLLEKEQSQSVVNDPLDTSEGVFTCDVCYKVFTIRFHLTEHMKTHEKDTISTQESSNISSPKSTPKSSYQMRRKSLNYCMYCKSLVTNFARHIFRRHPSTPEIKKIMPLPRASLQRKYLLTRLRKKWNYLNNSGKRIPIRESKTNNNYLPCCYCLGFYSSKNLRRHQKVCSSNPQTQMAKVEGQKPSSDHTKLYTHLEKLFSHMVPDLTSLVAKSDILICSFALEYLKNVRGKRKVAVVGKKMRELAKLLMTMKKLESSIKSFCDALKPQNFDLFLEAVQIICKDEEKHNPKINALLMGATLKQCCDIALKAKQISITEEAKENVKTLNQLIEAHWKREISNQFGYNLSTNSLTLIELATDIKVFYNYLIDVANASIVALEYNNTEQEAYATLAEAIYCQLTLINSMHPGELQRLPLDIYKSFIKSEGQQSKKNGEALTRGFKRISFYGEKDIEVAVLFSKDIELQLNTLLIYRSGIMKVPNKYLFGNPLNGEPLNGFQVMTNFTIECGAKVPDAITCTTLRKYSGTLSKLLSMNEDEIEQLIRLINRTLGVEMLSCHVAQDDVVQIAKISKIIFLLESKEILQFKGKSLDQIDMGLEENLLHSTGERQYRTNDVIMDKEKTIERSDNCLITATSDISQGKEEAATVKKETKKGQIKRIPWEKEQKSVVEMFFKDHIKFKKPPRKRECEKLINMHKDLFSNKTWVKIKVYVQNRYTKKLKY